MSSLRRANGHRDGLSELEGPRRRYLFSRREAVEDDDLIAEHRTTVDRTHMRADRARRVARNDEHVIAGRPAP